MELEYNKAQGHIDVTVNNTIIKALERFPAEKGYGTPYQMNNMSYTGSQPQSKNEKDESPPLDTKEIKELQESEGWEIFNFFNNGIQRNKPASTGLTILQRCKN